MAARLDEFRASLAAMRNRAVFEIPQILARILEAHPPRRRVPVPLTQATATYH
jgi:hypothetical protein